MYLGKSTVVPCGMVETVRVLFTKTTKSFSSSKFKNGDTFATNGRCPISWDTANLPFMYYKQNVYNNIIGFKILVFETTHHFSSIANRSKPHPHHFLGPWVGHNETSLISHNAHVIPDAGVGRNVVVTRRNWH